MGVIGIQVIVVMMTAYDVTQKEHVGPQTDPLGTPHGRGIGDEFSTDMLTH